MSKPAAGSYYVINRVNSGTGEKLALTYNGLNNAVTLTPLTNADSQKWSIVNHTDGITQSFQPSTALGNQAMIVSGIIKVLTGAGYVFFARSTPAGGLSIQGGTGSPESWGAVSAASASQVSFANGGGSERYFWVLQSV